ncbi:hypothetical protein AN161_17285 [Lysinibacillus sp. FJAT-14222]|nr:hypothetical protein AN161_17285 [Lysinibacillus sp. FJAT-14222]
MADCTSGFVRKIVKINNLIKHGLFYNVFKGGGETWKIKLKFALQSKNFSKRLISILSDKKERKR